jgi:hypothetical protein
LVTKLCDFLMKHCCPFLNKLLNFKSKWPIISTMFWLKYLNTHNNIPWFVYSKVMFGREIILVSSCSGAVACIRVARFVLVQTYQNGKNITHDHKLCQTAINYTKWP